MSVTFELCEVEARILDRILASDQLRCEGWLRSRMATQAEKDLADEDRLVGGMIREKIAEQLGDPRCKWCGAEHKRVPEDLCQFARQEYNAADAIGQLLTPESE
jgi:hypothetical protein